MNTSKNLIAATALPPMPIRVHYRFWKKREMDEKVLIEMKREQVIGIIGMAFVIIGASLKISAQL